MNLLIFNSYLASHKYRKNGPVQQRLIIEMEILSNKNTFNNNNYNNRPLLGIWPVFMNVYRHTPSDPFLLLVLLWTHLSTQLKVDHHYGNLWYWDHQDDEHQKQETKQVVILILPDGLYENRWWQLNSFHCIKKFRQFKQQLVNFGKTYFNNWYNINWKLVLF